MYHEAIRDDVRQAAMNAFLTPPGSEQEAKALSDWVAAGGSSTGHAGPKAQGQDQAAAAASGGPAARQGQGQGQGQAAGEGKKRMVLVATDRMSRGGRPMRPCAHAPHGCFALRQLK